MSSDNDAIKDLAATPVSVEGVVGPDSIEIPSKVRRPQRRKIDFTVGRAAASPTAYQVGAIARLASADPAFKIMPDYDKILGGLIGFDKVMPDYGKVLAGLAGEINPIGSQISEITKSAGAASAFAALPDHDKIFGGLIGFDKVMPDYGKAIAGLAGIETVASRISDMGVTGPLSLIDRLVPEYDKALAGLAVIDAVAFHSQHHLLFDATRWEGSEGVLAKQAAQILSAQTSLVRFAESALGAASLTDLYNTLGQFGLVQAHLGAHAVKPDPLSMLHGATRTAGHLYDAYLEGLPPRPIRRRADVAQYGGTTQSALLVIESLTSEQLTDDDRDELADQMAPVVELQPWQTGSAQAREELFAALAEIEADLPDWLKAAWDDVERDGVKAASKIAHCVTECIDRTLRALAPPDDVLAWIGIVGSKAGWLDGPDHRPTRRAKIMFVMRHRSDRDARLAVSQAEALIIFVQDLVKALQTVKHSEAPTTAIMRSWVMAAEGALSQLLLHR